MIMIQTIYLCLLAAVTRLNNPFVLATGDCHMHAHPGLHPPHSRRDIAPGLGDPWDPAGQT
jgi:hypothetical protein